jgi:hypothetical protein
MSKLSPENVAELVANRLSEAFSCSQFMSLFENQTLSAGWTLGDALAVCYSLGHLALIVSLWEAFNDEAKISRILRPCRTMLPKHWGMSDGVYAKWRAVGEKTESVTFASFNACSDGTELLIFFSHYVRRILGASDPSEHSALENEPSGIRRQITDPILAASVCGMFIKASTATKEFLEQVPIDWFSPKTN